MAGQLLSAFEGIRILLASLARDGDEYVGSAQPSLASTEEEGLGFRMGCYTALARAEGPFTNVSITWVRSSCFTACEDSNKDREVAR